MCFHLAGYGQLAEFIGRVTDQQDTALCNAIISIQNKAHHFSDTANHGGRFHIKNIPAGTYTMQITCEHFAPLYFSITCKGGEIFSQNFMLQPASRQLESVTINGDRLQKSNDVITIHKIAQPVQIINLETIQRLANRRLDELLSEQSGIAMVSDLGAGNRAIGPQMQGFSSDYIMILIDGQPMTGRFNGNFDLSRISLANIERIEIIKGASSSLYGSEAMGGVINIITQQDIKKASGNLHAMYGTNNNTDLSLQGQGAAFKNKAIFNFGGDYYKTDGFNVNNEYLEKGQTAPPYESITGQARLQYRFNEQRNLSANFRYSSRNSSMRRDYGSQPFMDMLDENDVNIGVHFNHFTGSGNRYLVRYYFNRYSTDQSVRQDDSHTLLQEHLFRQYTQRLELQGSHDWPQQDLSLIYGLGGDYQSIYQEQAEDSRSRWNYFAYGQLNWHINKSIEMIGGLRYDGNDAFGAKLNPTIGAKWRLRPWLSGKASFGTGYKVPSYMQAYQVFTNPNQGYTVVGALQFDQHVQELQSAGLVQQIWSNAESIKDLQPERASSYNVSFEANFAKSGAISINGFYNKINNLINTEPVGIMKNGQQLFSFVNISRAFTSGLEFSSGYEPVKGVKVSLGYQYLLAKNRDIIDSIKAGKQKYATVRADGGIRKAKAGDYFALPNRSRHMANAQIMYSYKPWGIHVALRAQYRGKYGFLDIDNNGYIDRYDVFVEGYTLLHCSLQKDLWQNRLRCQLNIENIGNFTNYLVPTQPGRIIMAGIQYKFEAPGKKFDSNKH
ncbi:TonB-dependent receptor [Chitinophaga caeni]|uniref:TonB-dependent receptor n=1 Tax=Chitinophaga caeni TaxID=2029983 RepID=UPI0018E0AAA2|nr:TonB-dependent receptor [Chitinophaga caeni]